MENTEKYLAHWNKFFEDWNNDNQRATFDKDLIWKNRKGHRKNRIRIRCISTTIFR